MEAERRIFPLVGWQCLLLALLFHGAVAVAVPTEDAATLVRRAIDYWRDTSSYSVIDMTIHRPDWERTMSIRVWTRGQKESLVRVTAPPKDAGNGTLLLDNDMWSYNPKVNRVIKIPSSMMGQSWMGSDFSNNDLAKADDLIDHLAALEDHHGRDAAHHVLHRGLGVVVDVQLADGDLSLELGRERVDRRRQHAARPAPLGPEVHHHRLIALEHRAVPVAVRESLHVFRSHEPFSYDCRAARRAHTRRCPSILQTPRRSDGCSRTPASSRAGNWTFW